MRSGNVGLAIHIPKGRRVVADKVKVFRHGPRRLFVRILALEDDL